jgi:ribosomal protein S27AE
MADKLPDEKPRPRQELPPVDTFRLAEGLAKKDYEDAVDKAKVRTKTCPLCGKPSFFYNRYTGNWECLNPKCS